MVDADGSNERKVVGTWGLDSPPLWDPTGLMIAYVESWEDGRRALKVVSLEDGESWEILDMTGMRGVRPQDWSPDGRWIGFTEEVGRHELWIDRDVLEVRDGG